MPKSRTSTYTRETHAHGAARVLFYFLSSQDTLWRLVICRIYLVTVARLPFLQGAPVHSSLAAIQGRLRPLCCCNVVFGFEGHMTFFAFFAASTSSSVLVVAVLGREGS